MMKFRFFVILIILIPLVCCLPTSENSLTKNDLESTFDLDPINESVESSNRNRDKRKVEIAVGVKNAVLGFLFGKLNSFIDQKTQWVDQLDQTNLVKNKIHGIEPPKPPLNQLTHTFQTVFNRKVNAIGPTLNVLTSKLSASNGLITNLGNFLSSSSALKQSLTQLPSNIGVNVQASAYKPSVPSSNSQIQLNANLNDNTGADFAAFASI